jgi:hypothetical protein
VGAVIVTLVADAVAQAVVAVEPMPDDTKVLTADPLTKIVTLLLLRPPRTKLWNIMRL